MPIKKGGTVHPIICKYCREKFNNPFDINAHGREVHGYPQMFTDEDIERNRVPKPTKSEMARTYYLRQKRRKKQSLGMMQIRVGKAAIRDG